MDLPGEGDSPVRKRTRSVAWATPLSPLPTFSGSSSDGAKPTAMPLCPISGNVPRSRGTPSKATPNPNPNLQPGIPLDGLLMELVKHRKEQLATLQAECTAISAPLTAFLQQTAVHPGGPGEAPPRATPVKKSAPTPARENPSWREERADLLEKLRVQSLAIDARDRQIRILERTADLKETFANNLESRCLADATRDAYLHDAVQHNAEFFAWASKQVQDSEAELRRAIRQIASLEYTVSSDQIRLGKQAQLLAQGKAAQLRCQQELERLNWELGQERQTSAALSRECAAAPWLLMLREAEARAEIAQEAAECWSTLGRQEHATLQSALADAQAELLVQEALSQGRGRSLAELADSQAEATRLREELRVAKDSLERCEAELAARLAMAQDTQRQCRAAQQSFLEAQEEADNLRRQNQAVTEELQAQRQNCTELQLSEPSSVELESELMALRAEGAELLQRANGAEAALKHAEA
eukprot:RCo052175